MIIQELSFSEKINSGHKLQECLGKVSEKLPSF